MKICTETRPTARHGDLCLCPPLLRCKSAKNRDETRLTAILLRSTLLRVTPILRRGALHALAGRLIHSQDRGPEEVPAKKTTVCE